MIPVVSPNVLLVRRLAFLTANLLTYAALLGLLAYAIGWSWLNLVLVTGFAIFVPWSVLGFWNAAIGLALLFAPRGAGSEWPEPAVTLRTAVVMTIRNEDVARAIARLRTVQHSIDATGQGGSFAFFVLSDTSTADIAAQEDAAMAAWRADVPAPERLYYRRREQNTGFKAGNVMDFCRRWGDEFMLMLTLDADSLMSGAAVLHLVRLMQANPRFGIVQGLVTGLPSESAFARMFQFGMRHGMRSYTVGQAWWTGDCGPFWGHNAIIRVVPFRDHCGLPKLPGTPPFGGDILSHDQVEATLMRRAGFDVRLQPVAGGSWEDNPPTILDYIRRDLRWCQGNLQYVRLLGLPGLRAVSRFQLVWAILMFIGIPAWTVTIALLPVAAWALRDNYSDWLIAVYSLYLLMYLSPKLAGYAHTAASQHRRARYGGMMRFVVGVVCELAFSMLQFSITSLHVTGFIVALLAVAPGIVPWALPFTLGYVVAIPFAVVTSHKGFGNWCARRGLCAVPEEYEPPAELIALSRGTPGGPR
jgi:membrane glycosyltransferase